MPKRFHARGSARSTGLLLAIIVAAALGGSLVWITASSNWGVRPPKPVRGDDIGPVEPPPDIMRLPTTAGAGDPRAATPLAGTGIRVELADKADPTRRAMVIRSASIEPLEAKRYLVDRPVAWIFLRDGRCVFVAADKGRFYMPSRDQAPESGLFEGNVRVLLVDSVPADLGIEPAASQIVLEGRTASLAFDGTIGEVSTPDLLMVTGRSVDFAGRGVRVLVNELQQGIELLSVEREGRLTFYKPVDDGKAEAPATPPTSPAVADAAKPATPATPPTEPIVSRYVAVFDRDVRASDSGRLADGERLQVFFRLLDNRLPADAVGEVLFAGAGAATGAAPLPTEDGGKPGDAPPEPSIDAMGRERLGVLTWSGPLEVRSLKTDVRELERDHVFARLLAGKDESVVVSDAKAGGTAFATEVAYAATTRDLHLKGEGRQSVVVAGAGRGSIAGPEMLLNLATGVGLVGGPGEILVAPSAGTRLSWAEQADFRFVARDDRAGAELREASFTGNVEATDGVAMLQGGFVRATFDDRDGQARLSRLIITEGGSVRDDRQKARLRADAIDATFAASSGPGSDAALETVSAIGGVEAHRDGSLLTCDTLDVGMKPDAAGRTVLSTAVARGTVNFFGRDGVRAEGPLLEADAIARTVDILGEGSLVAKDSTVVRGSVLKLDETLRRLRVESPGTFEHEGAAGKEARPARVAASWTRSMVFTDTTGVLEADGDASVVWVSDALSVDKLTADTARLELEPRVAAAPTDTPDLPRAEDSSRKIMRMSATGSEAAPAKVEVRRYAAGSADLLTEPVDGGESTRRLERLFYIEGQQILGDEQTSELRIPGPGKLLLADRRAPASTSSTTPSARGTALFGWSGDFAFNRASGIADLNRDVTMKHEQADGALTELESSALSVRMSMAGTQDGDLLGADARGGVYVRSADRELRGDTLAYDAKQRTIEAQAVGENIVTLFDPTAGATYRARRLFWDLLKGRVEIREPAPIIVPR
jgi:lipopolysaccharide export system protein LptA